MTTRNITIAVEQCDIADCSHAERVLIRRAQEAGKRAYAPYSHFNVGAAALLANGEIVIGCNQENAAFPSGLCAERVALFAAGVAFPDVPVKAIALAAQDAQGFCEQPVYPCGACRQVMLETEHRSGIPLKVIMAGATTVEIVQSSKDLLPLQFEL
ncbi:cytidine deaminase [Bacteroidia bacterium]|nr:cytidine deaminase [Bacteroidia bacterium]